MTNKMQNALNHIKTSADVDDWAVEEVERVFSAVDEIKTEISTFCVDHFYSSDMYAKHMIEIIDKYIGG